MNEFVCRLPLQGCNTTCIIKTNWSPEISFKIYCNGNTWTGQLKEENIINFSSLLSMPVEEYMKVCKSVLTCHGGGEQFTYAIDEGTFSWTKIVQSQIKIKFGFVEIKLTPLTQVIEDLLNHSLDLNIQHSQMVDSLKMENEKLTFRLQQMSEFLEKEKLNIHEMESELYCQFLHILNTKKDNILRLEKELLLVKGQSDGLDIKNNQQCDSMDLDGENNEGNLDRLINDNECQDGPSQFSTLSDDHFNLPRRAKRK